MYYCGIPVICSVSRDNPPYFDFIKKPLERIQTVGVSKAISQRVLTALFNIFGGLQPVVGDNVVLQHAETYGLLNPTMANRHCSEHYSKTKTNLQ